MDNLDNDVGRLKLGDKVRVAHFSDYYMDWKDAICTVIGLRLMKDHSIDVTIIDDADSVSECDGWSEQELEIIHESGRD